MGYENLMLICTIVSTVVAAASFVLNLIKALSDEKDKSE